MSRPLKKDGTEDMRYQDTFDGGDFALFIGLAIVSELVVQYCYNVNAMRLR